MNNERELNQIQQDVDTLHNRTQDTKLQLSTHEAVCAERWKETILRIKRIEHIMIGTAGTTIILLVGLLVR